MLRAPTHFVELNTTTKTTKTTATAAAAAAATTTTKFKKNSTTIATETPNVAATTTSFIQRWSIGKTATTKTTPTQATKATTTIKSVDDKEQQTTIVEKFYNERTFVHEKHQTATTRTTPTQQKSSPIFTREHLTTKILLLTTPFSFKKTKKPKNLLTTTTAAAANTPLTATTIAVGELTTPKVTIQQNCCSNFSTPTNPKHKNIKQQQQQKQQEQKELQATQPYQQQKQPKSRAPSVDDIGSENVSITTTISAEEAKTTYPQRNNTKNCNNNNHNNNNNNITCNHNSCDNNKENISQNIRTNFDSTDYSTTNSRNSCSTTRDPYNSKSNSSVSLSTASSLSLSSASSLLLSFSKATTPKSFFHTKSTRKTSTTPPTTPPIANALATTTSATTSLNVVSARMSPTSQTPTRTSLFDSCHRKIRLIGGGPVAFLGGLVAKARRKERDGDQNSTDTKLYLEESVLERKLPEADLKALVDLPAGLDYNEWLASHTLALFEHVNLVYGTISEFCTPSGCPDMTGPGNRTYLWFDEKGKKTRVAAPQYIDYVMTFTQKTVSDESIFPTKYANEFPSSFESIARKILRLQFHVIAHLYAAHFREIALLGLHTHLNLTFAHLTALHRRFNLIDEKETDVLRDLEVALRLTDDNSSNSGHSNSNSNTQASSETASMVTASSTATSVASSDAHGSNIGGGGGGCGAVANHTNSLSNNAAGTTHCNAPSNQPGMIAGTATATAAPLTRDDGAASTASTSTSATHASLIDGDAGIQPICTQPEAASKPAVFGGGDGLIGGILGDLSSGEFGDTTRYCTSAVPISSVSNSNFADDGGGGGGGVGLSGIAGVVGGINSNNSVAATLHLNFNNNNHNLHYHHHHHAHHLLQQQQHHHPYQQHTYTHPHQHQHQQNSGLIQCNASNAPSVNAAAVSVSNAAATAAANSTASTSAA